MLLRSVSQETTSWAVMRRPVRSRKSDLRTDGAGRLRVGSSRRAQRAASAAGDAQSRQLVRPHERNPLAAMPDARMTLEPRVRHASARPQARPREDRRARAQGATKATFAARSMIRFLGPSARSASCLSCSRRNGHRVGLAAAWARGTAGKCHPARFFSVPRGGVSGCPIESTQIRLRN